MLALSVRRTALLSKGVVAAFTAIVPKDSGTVVVLEFGGVALDFQCGAGHRWFSPAHTLFPGYCVCGFSCLLSGALSQGMGAIVGSLRGTSIICGWAVRRLVRRVVCGRVVGVFRTIMCLLIE